MPGWGLQSVVWGCYDQFKNVKLGYEMEQGGGGGFNGWFVQ